MMNTTQFLLLTLVAVSSLAPISHGKTTVRKYETEEEVAIALARYTSILSTKYVKEKGSFSVVLSGGTMITTLRKLVEAPYVKRVDWSKWMIFWVDDRVVPLDDPLSNYKLAFDGFLSKVPIPAHKIYPINYNKSPQKVAENYESRLKALVQQKKIPISNTTGYPQFDLMLLGVGPDGHLASLFPNRPQRYEKKRWVTFVNDAPRPPPLRMTMTFPVINSASNIAMVVTDSAEAYPIAVALHSEPQPNPTLPCSEVRAQKELTWFLNRDAASRLH